MAHFYISKYKETTLQASNNLTSFLHDNHRARYLRWNEISLKAKKFMDDRLEQQLVACKENYSLDQLFLDCVKWDVLGAIMEYEYNDIKRIPDFFTRLLYVYESGNFPVDGRVNGLEAD